MSKFLQHEVLSLEELWDELVFSEARVRYDDDAKDLVPQISPVCDKVLAVRLGQLNSWKAEHFAQANVNVVNDVLDAFTIKFERSVRRALEDAGVAAPGQDPRYKAYFPEVLSRITERALRSQLETTKAMLAQLRTEKTPEVSVHLSTMEALYGQGTAAIDEQQQAEVSRRNHRNGEIMGVFEEANNLRKSLSGILTTREVERKRKKGWAEGFFRKSSRVESDIAEVKQDAISLTFKARRLALSKENQKKLYAQTDLTILDNWISKVGTIANESELFS